MARQSHVLASPPCHGLAFTVRRKRRESRRGLAASCRVNVNSVFAPSTGTCRNSWSTLPAGSVYFTISGDPSVGLRLISFDRFDPEIAIRTTFGTEPASGAAYFTFTCALVREFL